MVYGETYTDLHFNSEAHSPGFTLVRFFDGTLEREFQ